MEFLTLYKKWLVAALATLALIGLGIWAINNSGRDGDEGSQSALSENDHVKGLSSASVTLVEYMDYQCPACAAYAPVVEQLLSAYPEDLRIAVRHYPLIQIHPNALPAARAAEAAARQDQFWGMHDLLFAKQAEWSKLADPAVTFAGYAQELGLDVERFRADMSDGGIDEHITWSRRQGDQANVRGTPTFVLNGERIVNPNNLEEFKALIDAELGQAEASPEEPAAVPVEGQAVHEHADFKVYLNGAAWDFSQEKYQSSEENPLAEHIHLHDGVGHVIHKHWSGVTLGDFFASLGMELTKGCFRTDTGEAYCSGPQNTLKVWVNGAPSERYDTFEFQDGDRILISYGSESNQALQAQMDSVTRDSCIYSEKCPERGTPPTEACVGGLGTNCEE